MGHRRLPSDILLRRGHHNWHLAQLMLTPPAQAAIDSIAAILIAFISFATLRTNLYLAHIIKLKGALDYSRYLVAYTNQAILMPTCSTSRTPLRSPSSAGSLKLGPRAGLTHSHVVLVRCYIDC
jgi:hypothetical protein